MNITIKLDNQEEFRLLMEAIKELPFLDKLKVSVATPEDFVPSEVKKRILGVLPAARLYLFGSRARGEAAKYSDWDFMVVTPQEPSAEEKETIFNSIFELELGQGLEIQLLYRTTERWEAEAKVASVTRNAATEGIAI
ncbi:MAG: nucleotidyltransferase domain-containing protein [Bacteroidota bacterium]